MYTFIHESIVRWLCESPAERTYAVLGYGHEEKLKI